jgi:hypothetical protein
MRRPLLRVQGHTEGAFCGRPEFTEATENDTSLFHVIAVDADAECGRPHLCLQIAWHTLTHDVTVVDDGDAIGELIRFFEVLRREEDSRACVVESAHLFPQGEPAHRVETSRRLVEEQH